ncbi:MAG: DUF1700 domain-containing protein [Oscillospiraceae bacterium]
MTRLEFLDDLERCLRQLPETERSRRREYFSEMLDDMIEDGASEAEAVARLGSPTEAAERVLQDTPLPLLAKTRVMPKGGWTGLNIALIVLGFPLWFTLLAAFAIVLLSVYLAIWALIASVFCVVIAIALSGGGLIVLAIACIPIALPTAVMFVGIGIACAGLVVFAFLAAVFITKELVRLTVAIARWVKKLFIRRENMQ